MKHVFIVNIYISLHFSKTVGTIGTSPKLYKEITCVSFKLIFINTVHKITLYVENISVNDKLHLLESINSTLHI